MSINNNETIAVLEPDGGPYSISQLEPRKFVVYYREEGKRIPISGTQHYTECGAVYELWEDYYLRLLGNKRACMVQDVEKLIQKYQDLEMVEHDEWRKCGYQYVLADILLTENILEKLARALGGWKHIIEGVKVGTEEEQEQNKWFFDLLCTLREELGLV